MVGIWCKKTGVLYCVVLCCSVLVFVYLECFLGLVALFVVFVCFWASDLLLLQKQASYTKLLPLLHSSTMFQSKLMLPDITFKN